MKKFGSKFLCRMRNYESFFIRYDTSIDAGQFFLIMLISLGIVFGVVTFVGICDHIHNTDEWYLQIIRSLWKLSDV